MSQYDTCRYPYFWLYYNLDMTAGITLHFIDDKIDTGDIVGQGSYKIELGTPASEVGKKLITKYAVPLLINAINTLENTGKLKTNAQPADSPTSYAKQLTNEEYIKILDFENWTLEHVWHVLHSNEQWRAVFLPKIRNGAQYKWSVGNIEKKHVTEPFGEIGLDGNRYYIKHKQGVIYLNRKISIKQLIKSLLSVKDKV